MSRLKLKTWKRIMGMWRKNLMVSVLSFDFSLDIRSPVHAILVVLEQDHVAFFEFCRGSPASKFIHHASLEALRVSQVLMLRVCVPKASEP